MQPRTMRAAIAACLATGLLAACGGTGRTSDDAEKVEDPKDVKLALSVNGAPLPFYETLRESAEKTAEEKGVELRVVTPTTPEEQNRSIDSLLAQDVNVIGVAPIDAEGVVPAIERANADNVPVITADETAAGGEIYTYIASPNEEGGVLAGEWMADATKGQAKLAIVEGGAGSSTNNARIDGFKSVVDKSPGIDIVASTPADWVTDKAFDVARDMLTAHPDLTAFFAINDAMAAGVVQAVQQSGKKDIQIAGYNGDPDAFKLIREGKMQSTVAQDPARMGRLFVEQAIAAATGKPAKAKKIDVPVEIVDEANIAEFGN